MNKEYVNTTRPVHTTEDYLIIAIAILRLREDIVKVVMSQSQNISFKKQIFQIMGSHCESGDATL